MKLVEGKGKLQDLVPCLAQKRMEKTRQGEAIMCTEKKIINDDEVCVHGISEPEAIENVDN